METRAAGCREGREEAGGEVGVSVAGEEDVIWEKGLDSETEK